MANIPESFAQRGTRLAVGAGRSPPLPLRKPRRWPEMAVSQNLERRRKLLPLEFRTVILTDYCRQSHSPDKLPQVMKWNDFQLRLQLSPTARKRLGITAILLVMAYLACGGYIWWAMHQSPETFGRVMAKMPGPVPFLLFPFETLWLRARAGTLQVGDAAPDFSLLKLDKTERVRLSTLNQQQPVVLVFGSYT